MSWNRRELLLAAGAALLGPSSLQALGAQKGGPTKKVLFFTKSDTFEHSVVARKDGKPSLAERVLTGIGKEHGFEVVGSKDGRLFEPDVIGQWDAFVFETQGNPMAESRKDGLPMSKAGKQALIEAVRAGKGFVGLHCATDTFGVHGGLKADDPYTKMIGGNFVSHGSQQVATMEIADPSFPGVSGFGTGSFQINDEWYTQTYWADDLHVILVQKTEGMVGDLYHRPNYPATWARMEGKGRVFYTSMGHRDDVFENSKFQGLILGALNWATGQVDCDVTPNVMEVTPRYKETPAAKKKA